MGYFFGNIYLGNTKELCRLPIFFLSILGKVKTYLK